MATIPYLPPEILTNIFVRLPIETLSNVILVNKSYLGLISSRDFARAHLEYSKQSKSTADFSDVKCIFNTSSDDQLLKPFYQFSFASSSSSFINVVDLDYPTNRLSYPDLCLVGSCNGLACIVSRGKQRVFLWNPCTGKYNKLSRLGLGLNLDCKKSYFSFAYGFVYDEFTDDYKVLVLCPSSPKKQTEIWTGFHYEIYVFSLKRNSWTRILPDLEGQNWPLFTTGKLISEKVHWLLSRYSNYTRKIISFDVEIELFGTVELPSTCEAGLHSVASLDSLEGCICLLLRDYQRTYVELWVMKEYGVKESWTKVFNVSCVSIPNYFRCGANVLPNGEILFYSSSIFVVYNPREDSFRFPSIRSLCHDYFKPLFYVPSLVSPFI